MTPAQCRAARGYLKWSQPMLGDMANVAYRCVQHFECGKNVSKATLGRIQQAFSKAGVIFMFGGIIPAVGAARLPLGIQREEYPVQ